MTGLHVLYRQIIITPSVSNIALCLFHYPFPVALGMNSEWKF
jgi:hypothetical protein